MRREERFRKRRTGKICAFCERVDRLNHLSPSDYTIHICHKKCTALLHSEVGVLLEPERTLKLAEAFDGTVGDVAAKDLLDDHHAPKKLHLVDMPNAQRNRQQSRESGWRSFS